METTDRVRITVLEVSVVRILDSTDDDEVESETPDELVEHLNNYHNKETQ